MKNKDFKKDKNQIKVKKAISVADENINYFKKMVSDYKKTVSLYEKSLFGWEEHKKILRTQLYPMSELFVDVKYTYKKIMVPKFIKFYKKN